MLSCKANAKALLWSALLLPGLSAAAESEPVPPLLQNAPFAPETAGAGNVLALEQLEDYRGGTEVANSNVSSGTVHDASAINVATGMNTITGGAFANASGLPIVIQNSGANVLIQNSTIVNVQFK